ncbi:MAG: helix-turn-helix transcriptional regulator [Eggerthellaceae bacterium]|nr:helix-turn-helix transcriptional regulator [Eggerthellaceae bacterium]
MENHVRDLRKEQGVSQSDLANALGVSRQTIISLENGRYTASLPLAFRIARYFDKPIEDIFVYSEED